MKPEHLRDLFNKQKVNGSYTAFLESLLCACLRFVKVTPMMIASAREAAKRA